MSQLIPAVFLDRDGVINRDTGYTHKLEELEILPGVAQGCKQLVDAGFALIIVTNQSGIARGLYSESQFQTFNSALLGKLAQDNVRFLATYHCPHHKDGEIADYSYLCDCRKPLPGMLLKAANEHPIDLVNSYIVGDRPSDLDAGTNAGLAGKVLIETGKPITQQGKDKANYLAGNFQAATEWILTDFKSRENKCDFLQKSP